jgi:hypothetical protein
VISILADHNIEGQASLLWGTLNSMGWLELMSIRLMRFADAGLSADSTDREVWEFVQQQKILLLTANRNMDGEDSLEHVIRELNAPSSLPVITISNADRMIETEYRERCAARLVEIVVYVSTYAGSGRIYIP